MLKVRFRIPNYRFAPCPLPLAQTPSNTKDAKSRKGDSTPRILAILASFCSNPVLPNRNRSSTQRSPRHAKRNRPESAPQSCKAAKQTVHRPPSDRPPSIPFARCRLKLKVQCLAFNVLPVASFRFPLSAFRISLYRTSAFRHPLCPTPFARSRWEFEDRS
jgi:hypothetical protein